MKSKSDTSNNPRVRVLHLSTLEHSIYRQSYKNNMRSYTGSIAGFRFGFQKAFLITAALVLALFYPASVYVYAEGTETPTDTTTTTSEPAPAATTTEPAPALETAPVAEPTPPPEPVVSEPVPTASTAPPTNLQGPTSPTGADGDTYVYNPTTGLWENDYYTWDPVSKKTSPKTPQDYSFNPETGMWDTTEWRYDAPSGKYVPNTVSVASNTIAPASAPSTGTGGFFDLYYNASISNVVVSQATTGNALVSFNTTGGSALTGDALILATLLNLVNSSTGYNGQVATFSSDIHGDVVGDLYIDPSVLAALQPATGTSDSDLTVKVQGQGSLANDVTLNAQSGDATVEKNTTAGNATTGNADAVLNLINILNSVISSGSSFVGMLNIYGNLNGDILLPLGLLGTLLASNSNSGSGGDLNANLSDTQSITNLVNNSASSGNATVANNTTAGSATTGDASTNITLLNLTGRQVVGSNSLLVFVNVLGKWVGVIMDAPAGSTSAALGTGVTKNDCSVCSGGDTNIDANTSSQIYNDVSVNAASGDANVNSNTRAGNATTGDAHAGVNILNISNSAFNFDDWFGVLFINVFGTWNGSFGVDTDAGKLPKPANNSTAEQHNTAGAKVFKFVPNGNGTNRIESAELDDATYAAAVEKAVLATNDDSKKVVEEKDGEWVEKTVQNQNSEPKKPDLFFPAIGFAVGGSLLGAERAMQIRNRRKLNP